MLKEGMQKKAPPKDGAFFTVFVMLIFSMRHGSQTVI